MKWFSALFFILFGGIGPVTAQIKVIPGEQYDRSFIHRIFFGSHYRNTWSDTVSAPGLKISEQFKIEKAGGSRETKNLRLIDKEGKEWVLRSVDKDLSNALPEKMRKPLFISVARDMASANHPYAPLMVAPIAEAIGIIHSTPVLYIITDEPQLGEYRKEFANIPAMLEERPDESWVKNPLFLKSDKIIGSEKLWEKVHEKKKICFDTTAYLRGRLLDILVGDWSRHDDQYRWIETEKNCKNTYTPVPRDRDHAFYKNDGVINSISKIFLPKMVSFRPHLRNIKGLTMINSSLDSLILKGITKEVFVREARFVQGKVTDQVIAEAVGKLPQYEGRTEDAEKFGQYLKERREKLEKAVVKWHRYHVKRSSNA